MRQSNFRPKSIAVIVLSWMLLIGTYAVNAQPAMAPAPKPRVAAMVAPKPTPVRRAVPRPAPRPAVTAMVAPKSVAAPAAAPVAAPAMEPEMAVAMAAEASMAAAQPEPAMAAPAAKSKSADSQAAFWITTLVTPVVLLILGILGRFALLKWAEKDEAQKILLSVRDGVKSFYTYSQGTDAEWDDAAAKLVDDVVEVLIAQGHPAPTEEKKQQIKVVAEKQKSILGPDKKAAEEKSAEEQKDA